MPRFPRPRLVASLFVTQTPGMPKMASTKATLSHLERTAEEPRDNTLHTVKLTRIDQVNPTIRLLQLTPPVKPIKFLPGQWLDVHCPSIPKPGGFTITSSPSKAYLELAIQDSPQNPAAAWLWRPSSEILNRDLQVRVGGSFTWPPPCGLEGLKKVVFLAGGVGINPLMSMLSFIGEEVKAGRVEKIPITFIYSVKKAENGEILFMDRLKNEVYEVLHDFQVHITEKERRMDGDYLVKVEDLVDALGASKVERKHTVLYVCGPPSMTDKFVEIARSAEGMLEENVLFEKWW